MKDYNLKRKINLAVLFFAPLFGLITLFVLWWNLPNKQSGESPNPVIEEVIFTTYAILALLIGLFTSSERRAWIVTFFIGIVVCMTLYFLKIYIEMGGIVHTFAFAFASSATNNLKQKFCKK